MSLDDLDLKEAEERAYDAGRKSLAAEIEQLRAEAAEWQATLGSIESARQEALDEIERLQSCLYAQESVPALYGEIGRLRAALQDAKDLAIGDAPAAMIIGACNRALASCP
jgi:chromosome segregation ATPase